MNPFESSSKKMIPENINPPESEKETEKQDLIIKELLTQIGELSISAFKLEDVETRHLVQEICAALQPILEEQYHARHPELHPETNMAGGQYRHRDEAISQLEAAIKKLQGRDIRTIEIQPERSEK